MGWVRLRQEAAAGWWLEEAGYAPRCKRSIRRRYARADTEYEYEQTTVEQFHGPGAYADK